MRLTLNRAVGVRSNRRGEVWQIADVGQRGRHSEKPTVGVGTVYLEREMAPDGFDEYRAARKEGGRAFALWGDPDRRRMLARVLTTSTTRRGVSTYEVRGAAGELVGTVVREPGARGGRMRTRWTVTPAGAQPLVGHKGQLGWWIVWWLLFPVQLVLGLLMIAALVLGGGDGDLARPPRRIQWRDNETGDVVLDYRDDLLEVADGRWDPRLVFALIALLGTYPGVLDTAWDKQDR